MCRARTGGVRCTFCLCACFALAIASRTAVEGPAGVVFTDAGVLGLAVTETLEVCRECRGDDGVTGVVGRNVETGVVARDLEALNVDVV